MPKVLVAYASKRGSTAEIARSVAETLRAAGLDVDCAETGDVAGVEGYDAVVLGSAVYMKRWRGDAKRFLRRNRKALAQRPFWIFSSGPVGEPKPDADESWNEPRKIVAQAEQLGARGHVVFGGRVPAEPHGPIEKAMVESTPPEHRDKRDWDEIRAWAERVAADLRAGVRAA
jgi:menaquinone-dependent protoporphyrinogen oxidase